MTGMPRAHANALANATPTRSEPTRPGPWVTATASTSASEASAEASARLDDAADVADVLARRQLRHDAAPLAVNGGLRGDDAGPDDPGPRRVAGLGEERRRGLVARRLDGQQVQAAASIARFRVSLYGASKMPRSVMIPVM